MGLVNTLRLLWKDETSGIETPISIQFQYGELWVHEYVMDDELIWGNPRFDEGKRCKEVMVYGIRNEDGLDSIPQDFDVYIIDNRISRVEPSDYAKYFKFGEDYMIVKE